MLTGENGILTQARKASEQTEIAAEKEAISLAYNAAVSKNQGSDVDFADLNDEFEASDVNAEASGNIVVYFPDTQRYYTVENGVVKGPFTEKPETAKTLVQAFIDGEIKVGDYITDYNEHLKNSSATVSLEVEETGHDGTQTYKVDNKTTWRVLGLNEDKTQLVITTGSPIKKEMKTTGESWETDPYLYLNNAEGWYHTNDELTDDNILDRICKIYDSDLAAKTQSMRIDDINMLLGLSVDKSTNELYKISEGGEKNKIEDYQGFFTQKYTYNTGNYAPENYLQQKYPSNDEYKNLTTKYIGDSVDGTAYMYPYQSPNIIDQSSKLYEVLFKGTSSSEGNSKAYWLASPGVSIYGSSNCYFGPGAVYGGLAGAGNALFYSDGYSRENWLAVRPVVYLDSNVSIEDLTISESGTEETWTTTLPSSYSGEKLEYGEVTERETLE